MPTHRAIGFSLACLLTPACTASIAPENSTTDYPSEFPGVTLGNAGLPTDQYQNLPGGPVQEGQSADYSPERAALWRAGFASEAEICRGLGDFCCSPGRLTGTRLFGQAAWYNLVGKHTASGEILDTTTATAAHRSLPLASFAKVTNLDNGRAVVVKINDRGPYTPGRMLDLSPRAADALDMRRVGVAGVVVEPLVDQGATTAAALQTSSATIAQ